MKLTRKSLSYYILSILILLIISISIFIYNRQASYEGKIKINAGIDSEIIIERDKNGIPFVKANSLKDAYFSIGFLHGQDRLALIEYFRAVARGRLSELTGKDGIFLDKLSLIIGFARKAEAIMAKLKSPYSDYLNSYVEGITTAKKRFYNSSTLKGISLSDWTAKDVISILLLFEWADSFLNNRELILPFPDKLNHRILKDIIPGELLYQYSDEGKGSINLLIKIRNIVREWIGPFQDGFAFYISSENTEDGKSASGFTLDDDRNKYPRWYPVSLAVGDSRIEGVTASGLPFILSGRNEDRSFFGFNLNVDTQDFYLETIRVINNIQQYYRNGSWNNFTLIDEKLYHDPKEKGEGELVIAARATDIGPVISDLNEKNEKGEETYCLSLNSILPDESYVKALFDIPFAASLAETKKLVWNIYSLPRIYLFAAKDDAACVYSGKIYSRDMSKIFHAGNLFAGNILYDISRDSRKLPANNIIIGNKIFENEPGIIRDSMVYKDIGRYNALKGILEKNLLSSKDIVAALNDTHSVIAGKFLPVFLPILEQIPLPSAKLCKIYFNNWDYNMDPESVAATIFNALLIRMIEETLDDEMGNSAHILMENYYLIIDKFYDLLLAGNSSLFDDIRTRDSIETRDNIFDRAFIKTLRYLNKECGPIMENWKWGAVHKGNFNMPLSKDSFFQKSLSKLKEREVHGGNSTIKKGEVSAVNLLKPVNISIMSGIFYLDLHLSFFSLSISPSFDPDSEYFGNYNKAGNFTSTDKAEAIHKLVLMPSGK